MNYWTKVLTIYTNVYFRAQFMYPVYVTHFEQKLKSFTKNFSFYYPEPGCGYSLGVPISNIRAKGANYHILMSVLTQESQEPVLGLRLASFERKMWRTTFLWNALPLPPHPAEHTRMTDFNELVWTKTYTLESMRQFLAKFFMSGLINTCSFASD